MDKKTTIFVNYFAVKTPVFRAYELSGMLISFPTLIDFVIGFNVIPLVY